MKAGKGKEVSYNALATHIVAIDGDNPEVSESREVFDLPVVKVGLNHMYLVKFHSVKSIVYDAVFEMIISICASFFLSHLGSFSLCDVETCYRILLEVHWC